MSAVLNVPILTGWFPIVVQATGAVVLVLAIGWRNRDWRRRHVPLILGVGAIVVGVAFGYTTQQDWADEPAPTMLWLWIGLTIAAIALSVVGWRSAQWWRRVLSLLSIPLTGLCVLLMLNLWVGYFQTTQSAWDHFTRQPIPNSIDLATAYQMGARGEVPAKGQIVSVDIDSRASHFEHRAELVYLPPAWFATTPAPPLPVVMMINGEFGFSTDWIRAGNAVQVADSFASSHEGQAPVMVFVDKGGLILRDTECVNGPHGNVADHLTKDVVNYVVSHFGVSTNPLNWAVAGYSVGGTCALDLAVMHPELFGAFFDIAGDWGPNLGNKEETIDRLYGGDREAWKTFDPPTVITRHGRYGPGELSGLFMVPTAAASVDKLSPLPSGLDVNEDPHIKAANSLCRQMLPSGIECAIVTQFGKHDWTFAARAFRSGFPWLASRVGTPGAPETPMPTGPPLMPPGA